MSCRTDYTTEEWNELVNISFLGAYLVVGTARKLRFSKVATLIRETIALQKFLARAKDIYPDNQLLQDILLEFRGHQRGERIDKFLPETGENEIIARVGSINKILAEKSIPVEAAQFKAFVYELAYEVCHASGDGFFGGGPKINADEARFLTILKRELLEDGEVLS
jgi:hypothetical protein